MSSCRKSGHHDNICHTPLKKNTFSLLFVWVFFCFFLFTLNINFNNNITTLLVKQNIKLDFTGICLLCIAGLYVPFLFIIFGITYLINYHLEKIPYIAEMFPRFNSLSYCVEYYIAQDMHLRQQHPVPNNIIECNLIMQ